MILKGLIELCSAFVCHLMIFDWMRGLPRGLEALLFVGVPIALSALLLRSRPKPSSSRELTVAFRMQIGRFQLFVALGPHLDPPANRIGE